MTKIGLISDTHGFLDKVVATHFKDCDEIWHAGDLGPIEIAEQLKSQHTLRAVYGNIDGADIRTVFSENEIFNCEEVKVMIRHIGGYPPRYNPETRKALELHKPRLFISGHSHILRIMFDPAIDCLYINPGAAGREGWHKMRTIVRFVIDKKDIRDCEVIELGKR
jgi:putative phosphoesterase